MVPEDAHEPPGVELDADMLLRSFTSAAALWGMHPVHAADQAGISRSALKRMRRKEAIPSVNNVLRMLVWMGETDLTAYVKNDSTADDQQPSVQICFEGRTVEVTGPGHARDVLESIYGSLGQEAPAEISTEISTDLEADSAGEWVWFEEPEHKTLAVRCEICTHTWIESTHEAVGGRVAAVSKLRYIQNEHSQNPSCVRGE